MACLGRDSLAARMLKYRFFRYWRRARLSRRRHRTPFVRSRWSRWRLRCILLRWRRWERYFQWRGRCRRMFCRCRHFIRHRLPTPGQRPLFGELRSIPLLLLGYILRVFSDDSTAVFAFPGISRIDLETVRAISLFRHIDLPLQKNIFGL